MPPHRPKFLFLYTEAAPYVIACLEQLAADHGVEVHLVRWPVNREAPFEFDGAKVHVRERDRELAELIGFVDRLRPDVLFTSGWVDKGYLRICREQHRRGIPVVMCSDTAWRGDPKQWLALVIARYWIRSVFSHAWVTGEAQAEYARRLGFRSDRIKTGFYSADTHRFIQIGEKLLGDRKDLWPHRFLCVARYIPTKGHQYLCDAFAELCDEGAAGDWELWFAGTGELLDQVKNSTSGKHPRIKHLGFKQPQEMEALLDQAGVFVLPSLYEPWGVVVHEHACAGMPMILSDAVGAAERFLKVDENGVSFKAGDKEALKNALRTMITKSDRELRSMAQRSMDLAKQWDPPQWARTAMEFFSDRP